MNYYFELEPKEWLKMIDDAPDSEKRKMVTALIAQTIIRQRDQGTIASKNHGRGDQPSKSEFSPQQTEALYKMLESDNVELRNECVYALGVGGDHTALPVLRRLITSDPQPWVHFQVNMALRHIGGPEAVEILVETSLSEPDSYSQLQSIYSLEELLPTIKDKTQIQKVIDTLDQIARNEESGILTRTAERIIEDAKTSGIIPLEKER